MLKVLRMGIGDRLVLMDGSGARFLSVIRSATRQEVTVIPQRPLPHPPPSPVEIILCQALLKSGPMDYLIQKTSELGVDSILPFFASRSVVRPDKETAGRKMRHWEKICRSSAKQAGRIVPAHMAAPVSFGELSAELKKERGLKAILWEGEGERDLKALLKDSSKTDRFMGIIGPEGGFTAQEIHMAEGVGFIPVSLGNRILRSETAATAMVAIVQYEWGDLAF